MKPWRLSLLVLALATVVALGAFVLSVAASPGGGREVVVGLYQNPPKVYLDGAGRPAGLFVELLDVVNLVYDFTLFSGENIISPLSFIICAHFLKIEANSEARSGRFSNIKSNAF